MLTRSKDTIELLEARILRDNGGDTG